MKTILCITFFIVLPFISFSQKSTQKCSSYILLGEQLLEDPLLENKIQDIEEQTTRSLNRQELSLRTEDSIFIPVIVHILYHTSAENLSDEQVQSQIDALNRDFNAQNKDIMYTPSVYKSLVAKCNIHFALANQDENGREANGIVRKFTTNRTWNKIDDLKIPEKGGLSGWDASKYLNIWVGNLDGNVIAVSSFPGMKKELDGVVIDYSVFGTIGPLPNNFNQGRTCVHEVGHWLNLYHISGDTPCGDDFVADTPPQKTEHYYKPTFPKYSTCNSTTTIDMTMNYMTYVDDDRMYMFTNGQKKRMLALFERGGVRESLRYSTGWVKIDKKPVHKYELNVTIFPNPVTDELDINMDNSDPVLIQIIDTTGNLCYQSKTTSCLVKIDVYDLLSGLYCLKIIRDKDEIYKIFVKIQ